MIPLVALACVASTASAGPAASNFRPIIGVVSEPVVPENQKLSGEKANFIYSRELRKILRNGWCARCTYRI